MMLLLQASVLLNMFETWSNMQRCLLFVYGTTMKIEGKKLNNDDEHQNFQEKN